MISAQQLPACCRHVKGSQAADILYTLAKYTSPKHIRDTDAHKFHSLLCASGIITIEHPLPVQLDTAACFRTVSEYHCGHLCPMCPYSARNRNRLEAEEAILLSYALKDFPSFQFLLKSGLTAEHFQALFLLNDAPSGKAVSTLPLFRLAYSYICHAGNEPPAFKALPSLIANALDENNRGKLLPQNIQNIRTYLERLQAQCRTVTAEKLRRPLACVLHPETEGAVPQDAAEEALSPAETPPSGKAGCIDGLLGSPALTPSGEKQRRQREAPDIQGQTAFHTDNAEPQAAGRTKQPPETDALPDESLFYPAAFSAHEIDGTGYPFYAIGENAADLRQLEVFLQFNPLVGMEPVTDEDTGRDMLLLCASSQFYYVPAENGTALSLFRLYLSKSPIRRQICMEPYRLYHFLQQNGINCRNVYSLRTAYRVLSAAKGKTGLKKPSEMIKELVSKTNLYHYPPYVFSMLQYVRMYEVMSSHPIFDQKDHAQRFHVLSSVEMFLGISYELKETADTQKPLFDLDDKLEYQFHYTSSLRLKEGLRAFTFTFSHEKPLGSLVMDILYHISRKVCAQIYCCRLLRFSQDSFTIAAAEEYHGQLCDAVAGISAFLAERRGLVPLTIKEDTAE